MEIQVLVPLPRKFRKQAFMVSYRNFFVLFLYSRLLYEYSKRVLNTDFLCRNLCREIWDASQIWEDPTIVQDNGGVFLKCNLLNDTLSAIASLMNIGSSGEAGGAMTNLLGNQLDVTTRCFVEHGCISMTERMQTTLLNTGTRRILSNRCHRVFSAMGL